MINRIKSLTETRNLPAWLVLILCLTLTWVAWSEQQSQTQKLNESEFDLRVGSLLGDIEARMQQNEQILLGCAGLFNASDIVSRAEWHAYIERLQLAKNYPGIQGVGFIPAIPQADLAAHTAAVRAEGFPHYAVRPLGSRPLYTPITYIEPFTERNQAAMGFDTLSDETRGAAMRRAIETGQTAISGKVKLIQETINNIQPGFLMYVPVYQQHMPLTTPTERWAALKGFVFSPYRIDDLMRDILGPSIKDLDFTIFDGPEEKEATRLFPATKVKTAAPTSFHLPLTTARILSVFGHNWIIRFHAMSEVATNMNSSLGAAVPILGGGISLLMFLLVWFLITRHEHAHAMAVSMTLALKTLHDQRLQEAEAVAQTMRATLYERDRHQQAVNAHAIVSVADGAGNITFVNNKFCAISGYSREALLGQNHRIVKSDAHSAEFYADMMNTLACGDIWSREICNRGADDQVWWIEMTIVPFLDANGLPYQYISISNDITQLKHSKEALRIAEEHFRNGQVGANLGTWDWDIDTGLGFWSEKIRPLLGYPPGLPESTESTESTFNNYVKAIHPDDRESVLSAINACVKRNESYNIEHRVVWPGGTVRWLLVRGTVERDSAGKAKNMSGVIQDIHERKLTELALAENEARLAYAIEGAGDGIWDWSIKTGAILLSGNYEGMLGYSKGELAPTAEAWFAIAHPDDLAWVSQRMKDYLEGKLSAFVVEYRLRCKNGSYKWILCRGTVVERDEGNQSVRMIGIHSDISVQKSLQTELEVARQIADRASQAKSNFLSSMSHELRTPMNAILGFAQLMQYDSSLSEDHQDNVKEIIRGGRHLLELINEVLDLGKIESGTLSLSLEAVALADLVEDCRRLIQPLAAESKIMLHLTVPANAAVRADRMRLKQVLLNLLSNAVKYNRVGGDVRLALKVDAHQTMRISVTDSGIGIAPEDIAQLFDPFSRLGAQYNNIEGTGIGLTITRRLIELMEGKIGVDSQLGVGSTFWIELPSEKITVLDIKKPIKDFATAMKTPASLRRVLCIDDNPANIALISKLLHMHPHIELITSLSPELGIELARAHLPELILLDINMPGLNGYQVLELIQSDPHLKSIPVIAVTANAMPHDIQRGREAGFADYLIKPLDVEQFLEAVERYLSTNKGKE